MKLHGKFWRNLKPRIEKMGKMKKKDTVRLRRFFKLLKIEQDKIKPAPSPDFYSRVACGLQKIGGADRDRSPYFSYRRRTLPWALVTAAVISVVISVYSFRAPLSPKLGIDEALFVLTPEVIVLESLSETEDSDSNGVLLNPDSKSDAQNSIEWSNRICMLRL